ncbi:MAG: OmpH family outer membrane protein [Rhodospirillaceae bacterium]
MHVSPFTSVFHGTGHGIGQGIEKGSLIGRLGAAMRRATVAVMLGSGVALGMMVAQPGLGQAQETVTPNARIAIIDMQDIMTRATAAVGVLQERERFGQTYQEGAAQQERALAEKQGTLAQRTDQGSEAFQQARIAFEAEVNEFRRSVTLRRQNLDRAANIAMAQVQDMVIRAANEVAGEWGVNLVLYRTQVLLFDPAMNMTEEVLVRVDQSLPSVAFPDPDSLANQNQ